MKLFNAFVFIAGLMLVYVDEAVAQDKMVSPISWTNAAKLPVAQGMTGQLGLAGVFTGVSNDVLLIAGGSNFANGAMPWQGGKKLHYDQIYALKRVGDQFTWVVKGSAHLPRKVAYGASVTVGGAVICAGGETETANSSRDVLMLWWDNHKQEVETKPLPMLPIPVANACMTAIGKKVYLFGGESNGKPSDKAFMLDLAAVDLQWKPIPDVPLALSHAIAVTQTNGKRFCIYLIGGRSSTPSGISKLHHTSFCYDPVRQQWSALAPVNDGQITNLSAASGVPFGANGVLVIGGDKGDIFHKIESYNAEITLAATDKSRLKLQAEKMELLNHHAGFSRDVLLYNTLTNRWQKLGELPFYGHVTTTAVIWDKDIFVPCGEIKPGIRTAEVLRGVINR